MTVERCRVTDKGLGRPARRCSVFILAVCSRRPGLSDSVKFGSVGETKWYDTFSRPPTRENRPSLFSRFKTFASHPTPDSDSPAQSTPGPQDHSSPDSPVQSRPASPAHSKPAADSDSPKPASPAPPKSKWFANRGKNAIKTLKGTRGIPGKLTGKMKSFFKSTSNRFRTRRTSPSEQ